MNLIRLKPEESKHYSTLITGLDFWLEYPYHRFVAPVVETYHSRAFNWIDVAHPLCVSLILAESYARKLR